MITSKVSVLNFYEGSDLHTHTIYSDGKNTPEEMIRSALKAGLVRIGISDHSYTSFDESYCMKMEDIPRYKNELAALKEKYAGRIEVLCGIEQDYYCESPAEGFDYVIGSVHYICCGKPDGVFIPVDESPEILKSAADKYFRGNIYALAAEYFRAVSDVISKTDADIIGHFDLISKFNEGGRLFDPYDPVYVHAWQEAADRLIETGRPFELNTGAMSRGYRTLPYPAPEMISYIREHGGSFILSSDAHSSENIAFTFSEYSSILY